VTVARPGIGGANVTIGIDLGGTGTRVVALDANGAVAGQLTLPTPAGETGAAMDMLVGAVRNVGAGMQVTAVGIGASGPVTMDGVIRNPATLPSFSDLDLCGRVSQRLGYRCVIDNDAAAAAVGEFTYGAGRGSAALLVVTLGTGIGVAVVFAGRLFRAGDGSHPEAGHIAVGDAPSPCYCGLAHCWEQAASRTALERLLAGDVADAADLARSGDTLAAAAFERYGVQVAAGLSTLLTIFRPDRVVIGGSAAQYLDLFSAALTRGLERAPGYCRTPPVVAADLGDLAGAIGAAVLARPSAPVGHCDGLG
jgi:glucokinase